MRPNSWILTLGMALALTHSGRAWDGHDIITATAVESVGWLDSYPRVAVTARTGTIADIQQAYKFEFHGEQLGDTLSAREILARYVAEPDWGPDQELRYSWQQRFMGGYTGMSSRAYFHMYYPAFTVHAPIPGIPMGGAHRRVALWYEESRRAFARRDPYWGFRYLACALHYIEDVGQPFHSTQTSIHFVDFLHPISGTTQITANYHGVYEAWVWRQMQHEQAAERAGGKGKLGLLATLRGSEEDLYPNIGRYVKGVASRTHRVCASLVRAGIAFFDRRFMQPKDNQPTEKDVEQLEPEAARKALLEPTYVALTATARSIRGFLNDNRPDLVPAKPLLEVGDEPEGMTPPAPVTSAPSPR
jgi:hypothetical protein